MKRTHRVASSLLALWLVPLVAVADEAHLFGDWGGERSRLSDAGFDFDFGYDSQLAHNLSGGTHEVTRYADQWKAGVTFDLDKLWGWPGASFKWLMTQRNGRDAGVDAGINPSQSVQDLYGRGQTLRLTVFAYEQKWHDGAIEWRIGRLPVGRDVAGFSCDFQNLTFCGSQPGNIVGDYWMNWPVSQWATVVRVKPAASFYIETGAYQVNPTYIDDNYARSDGWKPDFPAGTTGVLVPVELGWTPKPGGLPGTYKFGAWHSSAPGDDLFLDGNGEPLAISDATPLQHSSRRGAYIDFKQQVTGEPKGRGLTLFLRAVKADAQTSALDRQVSMGVEYHGPFGRDDDKIGFGVGATHHSGTLVAYQRLYNTLHAETIDVQDHDEQAAELFYSWSPVPSVKLRPNLEYVRNPGGNARHHDALVTGLYTSVTF